VVILNDVLCTQVVFRFLLFLLGMLRGSEYSRHVLISPMDGEVGVVPTFLPSLHLRRAPPQPHNSFCLPW
jgi:hypothetical protein